MDKESPKEGSPFSFPRLIYIGLILMLIYLVVTAWDDLFDFLIVKFCGLDTDTLFYRLLVVTITTTLLVLVMYILDEDIRSLLGIELI